MYLANVRIEKSPTVRVEKATSDLLTGPDWTMNMGICDTINTDLGQAKEMVKAVKKRLQNKNSKIQLLALTLLETMVKNCGEEVHLQIISRNILQEMVKIVKKKTDMHVRDKILVLLDSWQEAFGGPRGKYPQFYWAYYELRQSGVEFPQRSADAAPIFTPPATHPIVRHSQSGYRMPNDATRSLDQVIASEISSSDLDSMKNAMDLLADMLHAMNSNDHEGSNEEVVMDLVQQCKANQKKLEQMISMTNDEELLGKGLELNDCLQNLLAKHHAISTGIVPAKTGASGQTSSIPSVSGPTHFKTELSDIEEDDEFTQLARRKSKISITTSQTTQIGKSVAPSSINGASTTTTGQPPSTSSVSSISSLPNPPSSISTSTKEDDMIDLLSITLSESTSPHTSQIHSPSSTPIQTTQISSASPIRQYPYNPQYYLPNQGQSTYTVPWAQPQSPYPVQQSTTQYTLNYPPPPWATMPSSDTVTHPPTAHPNYTTTYTPTQAPRPLQQYNSMGPRGNHAVKGTNVQTGSQARQLDRQYVSSNRLFEDLIDLRSINNGYSTSGANMGPSGSTGQGVVGGSK